jgi:hypothetical protein
MRWRGCEADGVHVGVASYGAWRERSGGGCVRLAIVVGVVCACVMGRAESTVAATERCPNEEFRTGPSASLPDCRAYELVTPEELGRAQAITFTVADHVIPSADGEHLALETLAPLEPDPSLTGTRAVFSRTTQGWRARSIFAPGAGAREVQLAKPGAILSPDLSQVAFESITHLNHEEQLTAPGLIEVGPVGGPYALVADIPAEYKTYITGANAGTASVPAFADVLFQSTDHQLLPPGPERTIAEDTEPGSEFAYDLYDWTGGALRLVNVEGEGSNVKSLDNCAAGLGDGGTSQIGGNTIGAVSADGSKIFFTSCGRAWMRVDGRETVEVPNLHGVKPSERRPIHYNAATPDGSEVLFATATPLLAGETDSEERLFIYDTATAELKVIASGVSVAYGGTQDTEYLLSEDGSAVYYELRESIYRYETQTGKTSFVAAIKRPHAQIAFSYATPNGQFLAFVAAGDGPETGGVGIPVEDGVAGEPRGAGHEELYRYDAADGSVMCVSCGEGIAPAKGAMTDSGRELATENETPPFIQMSEDGQKVFFETTAQLVPQDTNSTNGEASGYPGMDVYEWEADGAEEAPAVLCRVTIGCTHLISTGEDVGKSTFLGASEDGRNIFLATAAQLVPQATPEFPNIYDARVDGGFAPPTAARECVSCQGVGSPPPLFSTPASVTFMGAGNPVTPVEEEKPKPKPKSRSKPKRRRNKTTKAMRAKSHKRGKRS